jgi:hypothetical protein
MGNLDKNGWSVSWRDMGNDNHIAMFSNTRNRTNLLFTEIQIHDAIDGREATTISKGVLIDALVAYSVSQSATA